MKTINVKFIDTASHGYYSVSKKDFKRMGLNPYIVSTYSGHTPTRLYLEEDEDAHNFFKYADSKLITVKLSQGYNERFKISHNYNPALFDYVPKVGDLVVLSDDLEYEITEMGKRIIVSSVLTGMRYRINKSNPFEHIKGVKAETIKALQ